MAFEPDYGETLVSDEEALALTVTAREVLGDPIRKADLYDLEQQIQNVVAAEWLGRVITGSVAVGDLLCDHVVRDLHRQLYAPVWAWGGRQRALETNIGTPPEGIAVGMRNAWTTSGISGRATRDSRLERWGLPPTQPSFESIHSWTGTVG